MRREKATTQILNQDAGQAAKGASLLVDFMLDEIGYSPEEAIPALMIAAVTLALTTDNPRQALDEAVVLLDEREPEESV